MTTPEFDPYAEDRELQEYRQRQIEEFAEWVATQDIYFGTALAHRRGDQISKSNVARHGYDKNGLAVKRNSKEGRAITGDEPAPEPVTKPAKSTGGSS